MPNRSSSAASAGLVTVRVWCTVLPSSRKVLVRTKSNGKRSALLFSSERSSSRMVSPSAQSRVCSTSRAKPC